MNNWKGSFRSLIKGYFHSHTCCRGYWIPRRVLYIHIESKILSTFYSPIFECQWVFHLTLTFPCIFERSKCTHRSRLTHSFWRDLLVSWRISQTPCHPDFLFYSYKLSRRNVPIWSQFSVWENFLTVSFNETAKKFKFWQSLRRKQILTRLYKEQVPEEMHFAHLFRFSNASSYSILQP